LPGAFGAGGLQALVKAGFSVGSRRVIVAGSGPLVLAVASFLLDHGAYVPLIAEQAPRGRLLRFAGSLLWQQPFKLLEALALRWKTRGTSYRTGCWPIRAVGHKRLESVTLTDGVRTWTEPCDALACGYGLVPNLELPMVLGCAIERGFVKVDEVQRTSIPNVYAVGELTGIGGLDKALIEGQIAGWAAAERASDLQAMMRQRSKYDRFVNALESTFSLRDELRRLGDDATIVCRCEDVHFGALKRFTNWRDAKLQTRCGMGPCQGRICGPAVDFLFGWPNDSVRPPIFPTALGNLISEPPA
jgi:NADPH-dependent 2,4-dienoyl-CoA reductase/sulfur reductase-like enzyme